VKVIRRDDVRYLSYAEIPNDLIPKIYTNQIPTAKNIAKYYTMGLSTTNSGQNEIRFCGNLNSRLVFGDLLGTFIAENSWRNMRKVPSIRSIAK